MAFHVKQVMTTNVVTVHPDETVDAVFTKMLEHQISGLPVVDYDDRLVGIVSERDFLALISDVECQSRNVSEFMTRNVLTVRENDHLTEVVDLYIERNVRRVPVVRDDKLIGIVSRPDLISFIRDLRARVRKAMNDRAEAAAEHSASG